MGLPLREPDTAAHLATDLGFTSWEHTPTFRGFSSFYGFYSCAQDYFWHGTAESLDFHYDKEPRCGGNCSQPQHSAVYNCTAEKVDICNVPGSAPSGFRCEACPDWKHYSTILFGVHARRVIDEHPVGRPLFLYLPSQDTHGPSDVPLNYLAPYEKTIKDPVRRMLAAKLSTLDELIKNVTEAMSSKRMLKDTLIIYTGPHSANPQQATATATGPRPAPSSQPEAASC